jgi:hypothetical protein
MPAARKRPVEEIQLDSADQQARVPEEARPRFVTDKKAEDPAEVFAEVPFRGSYYRLNNNRNFFVSMEYSAAFSEDGDDELQLAATYHLLEDIVHPSSWSAFTSVLRKARDLEPTELVLFVNGAIEALTARPTKADGTSSATA